MLPQILGLALSAVYLYSVTMCGIHETKTKTGADSTFSYKPERRNGSERIVYYQTPLERHAPEPC